MKEITVMSYNIGHLFLSQPWRHLPIGKQNIFFDRKDVDWISSVVKKFNPDIIFFQELTSWEDANFLKNALGYKHASFLYTSRIHGVGTGILHNFDNACTLQQKEGLSVHSVKKDGHMFTTVHLTPFSKKKRADELQQLITFIKKHPNTNHIIAGDFNLSKWKKWWFNKTDKKSYLALSKILNDATIEILSTHCMGYKFDYFFTSPEIEIRSVDCFHKTTHSIDHYPLILRTELNSSNPAPTATQDF